MSSPAADSRIAVLGVGNLIMSDEGVGVRAVEKLEREQLLPAWIACIDGGTSTHELLDSLDRLELLVIVDAMASSAAPGTVVRLEGAEIPSAFSNKLSPHQHGINDLLATLKLVGSAPARVVLFGVVPERISLGMELSPVVAAALPELCRSIVSEVACYEQDKVNAACA
jgi:hydrogenase maturation protease